MQLRDTKYSISPPNGFICQGSVAAESGVESGCEEPSIHCACASSLLDFVLALARGCLATSQKSPLFTCQLPSPCQPSGYGGPQEDATAPRQRKGDRPMADTPGRHGAIPYGGRDRGGSRGGTCSASGAGGMEIGRSSPQQTANGLRDESGSLLNAIRRQGGFQRGETKGFLLLHDIIMRLGFL